MSEGEATSEATAPAASDDAGLASPPSISQSLAPSPEVPALGAVAERGGTRFRVWATRAERVSVRLFDGPQRALGTLPLVAQGSGHFEALVDSVGPGALYKFVLDDDEVPDPYARFLPFGVLGPAEVMARMHIPALRPPLALERLCTYELHVGTFTPEGTYAAAGGKLAALAELGITAIELMPVAAFAGQRGWGYDGAAHYAPHAPYGRPEDLRAFVQAAHAHGLAVFLDAVYNHFGPRGSFLSRYAREYFTSSFSTPWGEALDFHEPHMRAYVLGSARMWLAEYGFDGLRLDATHAIVDRSVPHVLRELRELASSLDPPRRLVAEDDRNEPALVTETGLDALWADDFHHHVRVVLTGERDGYYGAYAPTVAALARAIERGWSYEGQTYTPWGRPRGKPADALEAARFVYCIENHDQAGNRAFGERLSQEVSVDAFLAATTLLLFLPMQPLLFMGQEWGASTPFLYFTDHEPELGALVSEGRREEFKTFRAFADPEARARIPDPQDESTFMRSKLLWHERETPEHARVLSVVSRMLGLRREDPVLAAPCERKDLRAHAAGDLLVVERGGEEGRRVLLANLTPAAFEVGPDAIGPIPIAADDPARVVFATAPFANATVPPYSAVILA